MRVECGIFGGFDGVVENFDDVEVCFGDEVKSLAIVGKEGVEDSVVVDELIKVVEYVMGLWEFEQMQTRLVESVVRRSRGIVGTAAKYRKLRNHLQERLALLPNITKPVTSAILIAHHL